MNLTYRDEDEAFAGLGPLDVEAPAHGPPSRLGDWSAHVIAPRIREMPKSP